MGLDLTNCICLQNLALDHEKQNQNIESIKIFLQIYSCSDLYTIARDEIMTFNCTVEKVSVLLKDENMEDNCLEPFFAE